MPNSQHEPTMEEILASIRKIISDDASAAPATTTAAAPEHGAAEPAVLDLTHEINEPINSSTSAPATPVLTADEIHTLPANEPTAKPVAEPASAPPAEPESAPQQEAGLFSEKTRKALSDAMAGIDSETPEPAQEIHMETHAVVAEGIAGLSVEAVFERAVKESFDPVLQKWLAENNEALVERMTPLIREWLDENFPLLLEDAIRSELARAKPRVRR